MTTPSVDRAFLVDGTVDVALNAHVGDHALEEGLGTFLGLIFIRYADLGVHAAQTEETRLALLQQLDLDILFPDIGVDLPKLAHRG